MEQSTSSVRPEPDEGFEALVRTHRGALERLSRRLARDPEDAEDLLQETLVDAFRAFRTFRADSHFYAWVARIMTNNHLDRVRRKHHPVVSLDQPGPGEGPETLDLPDDSRNPERLLLQDQLDHPFHSALEALQPLHRATVVLCDLDGATYEEAATAAECPIGTIRSRLHRAHKALREFLAGFDPSSQPAPAVQRTHSRRAFLRMGTAAAAGAALTHLGDEAAASPETVRVLVWSDGTAPPAVYPHGMAHAIAEGLRPGRRLEVKTTSRFDPGQGVSDAVLGQTDVLVWWGDGSVRSDRVAAIARRVRDEGMGLIVTHSTGDGPLLKALLGAGCGWTGGSQDDGSPVDLQITAPRHPIVRGLENFRIPRTERYEGEFEGPKPDVVVLNGDYGAGRRTVWQGMVWEVGKGRLFYFQPGHEAYPIYQQEEVRQVFRNASRWCARV